MYIKIQAHVSDYFIFVNCNIAKLLIMLYFHKSMCQCTQFGEIQNSTSLPVVLLTFRHFNNLNFVKKKLCTGFNFKIRFLIFCKKKLLLT